MIKSAQYNRLMWMTLLVVIAFFGLGWRLVDLQYLTAADSWKQFEERSIREDPVIPWRGEITDRAGNTLAASVRHYNIGADPSFNGPYYTEVARVVSAVLGMSEEELAQKIQPREYKHKKTGEMRPVRYVPVATDVPHESWEAIQVGLKQIGEDWDPSKLSSLSKEERQFLTNVRKKGVVVSREVQTRLYPNGSMAAPILGLVNSRLQKSSDPGGLDYYVQFGANGLEAALNKQLAGTPGRVRRVRTELVERVTDEFAVRDGANVALTLDRRIQEGADKAAQDAWIDLGAESVFITVMDVRTGEVLALSSAPTFDPTDRSTYKPELSRLLPLTEVFETGSLMKAIAISGALEDHTVNLDTTIFCENGTWFEPSTPLTDSHGHGDLTVKEIVTFSSNIGTAKITALQGHDQFYRYLVDFGLGRKTGIGLYEESGILHSRGYYKPVDFTRLPIGYATAVTQLQIANVYATIANQGVMMRPQILKRIEERNGDVIFDFRPQPVRRVITKHTSQAMMEALETVTGPGGTAKMAALDYYTVAGKTGTAHKYTGDPNNPYDNEHYYGSFVGVFPASAPQICIAVTVNEPDKFKAGHYGGKVAGPIFADLANLIGRHLNIKPDKSPELAMQDASSASDR